MGVAASDMFPICSHMPRRRRTPVFAGSRPHVQGEIVRLVRAGALLRDVYGTPGMPTQATVSHWRRSDPGFAAAVDQAKRERDWRRRWAFRADVAAAFLARYRAGGVGLERLCDQAGMPSRRVVAYWQAVEPGFAEDLGRLIAARRADAA